MRYVGGRPRRPLADRLWEKVTKPSPDGCWEWQGHRLPTGYGQIGLPGSRRKAPVHRVAYELLVGPIPDGLQIDHLCRNRACVNPTHLEAVTQQENIRRGIVGQKTHCPQGHPYDETNTYRRPGTGYRGCRACRNERARAVRRATSVERAA